MISSLEPWPAQFAHHHTRSDVESNKNNTRMLPAAASLLMKPPMLGVKKNSFVASVFSSLANPRLH
jgi:hypothetical protein